MRKCSVPQCGRYTEAYLSMDGDLVYENWYICQNCIAQKFGISLKKRIDSIRVGEKSLEEFIKEEKL